jgi:hypothetical protein
MSPGDATGGAVVCHCYDSSDEEIWAMKPVSNLTQIFNESNGDKIEVVISLGPGGLSGSCLTSHTFKRSSPSSALHSVGLVECNEGDEFQRWTVQSILNDSKRLF